MERSHLGNKTASILIYIIILVNVALIMVFVVANNTFLLESNYSFNSTSKLLTDGILEKANRGVDHTNYLNSNGTGIIDTIGCPTSVTMSGAIHFSSSSSSIAYSGGIVCTGIHNSKEFRIYFNTGFTDFSQAFYDGSTISLSGKTGTFSDTDTTFIDFSGYSNMPDNLDDDFNSDNYKANSSGSFDYPDNYSDDDVGARTTLYGYILPNTGYKNIFWSNTKIQEYIDANTNNSDTIHSKLGDGSGSLFLEVNKSFDIRVVEFNKQEYDNISELGVIQENFSVSATGSLGYIQNNLTLSGNITGNEYNFGMGSTDYAIFLQNTSDEVLFYKLIGEDFTGKSMYINPIDDSQSTEIKTLGYEILYREGKYIGKILEVVGKKE